MAQEQIEIGDQVQKKICTDQSKNTKTTSYPPQKINITIVFHVYSIMLQIDPESLKKFNPLKTVQNLLMWLLGKNSINPMWLLVHNKHLIQCGIFLDIYVGKQGQLEDSEFLQLFKDKKASFSCENYIYEDSHFWNAIFYTKIQDEPSFRRKKRNNKNEYQSYTDQIYDKYYHYILSQTELTKNLYPGADEYLDNNTRDEINKNKINIIALDCEMVKTTEGLELARISVVDFEMNLLLDEFVLPDNKILDYNTKWSGITEESLKGVLNKIGDIQNKLMKFIDQNTILIGHSLENDLRALKINHQKVIDTSLLYMTLTDRKLSLKILAKKYLNLNIQQNDHDSIEDAKIALSLAKLRIEILDNFDQSCFQANNNNPDALLNLQKQGQVCVLEDEEKLESLLSYNIKTLDKGQEKWQSLKRIMTEAQKVPRTICLRDKCSDLQILESKINQIYEACPQFSVLIIQVSNLEKNPFLLFITK